MLRVGLTGSLGSGKSTAARMFTALGAHVLSSDSIGRALMQPGEAVHNAIATHFGARVVLADGTLDRAALARIAFADGRLEELNALVHPAVIARQAELSEEIGRRDAHAVVIVESALIFETNYSEANYSDSGNSSQSPRANRAVWHKRFDRLILVTAPEELKIARFVARSSVGEFIPPDRRDALEAEARRRLAHQIPDEQKSSFCDYILTNSGTLKELEWQVDQLWPILQAATYQ